MRKHSQLLATLAPLESIRSSGVTHPDTCIGTDTATSMHATQWDGTSACAVGDRNGDAVGCRSHLKQAANVTYIPLVASAKLTNRWFLEHSLSRPHPTSGPTSHRDAEAGIAVAWNT